LAVTASNEQLDALGDDVRAAEYAMITSIISSGSGRTPEVLAFQKLINANLAPLNQALGMYQPGAYSRGARFVRLVEDGAYGKNTAAALTMALALTVATQIAAPPVRSAGLAAWAVQNQAQIEALVGAATSAPVDTTPPVLTQAQAPMDRPATSPANLPQEIEDEINGSGATAITSSAGGGGAAEVPGMTEVVFDVPSRAATDPVYGTARKGGMPWAAIGVGAGLVGGFAWWLGRKRKGR
jgi:hypothetical protein